MPAALTMPRTLQLAEWIRVSSRIFAMAALLLFCIPFYYLCRLLGQSNPAPRLFLNGVTALAGVTVTTRGKCASAPVFLIANHVSWIDIAALSKITGCAFVGHDGLAAMPLLKWLCKMNNTVFVARHDRASVAGQIEAVRAATSQMHRLTIFPEGTTSDGTGLLPFKSSLLSAFEPLPARISVQPVLLGYGAEAADIAWIGDEHGLDNFLRILARRKPVQLAIHFLPPLHGAALDSRKTIAAAAREAVMRELTS